MIKQLRKQIAYCIFWIFILGLLTACQLLTFGREKEIAISEASYTIAPDTILESLAQGKTDVFVLQAATPESLAPFPSNPVHWDQNDFLLILQTLHEFVWEESLSNWSFSSIHFGMDCKNATDGPQYAYFEYYKIVTNGNEQSKRIVHKIYILNQINTVSWVEIEYSPQIQNWHKLDITQIKIPVTDALDLAEKNGGFEARTSVKNYCKIGLFLAPGSEYDGWQVSYSGNHGLFSIWIDPFTGKYQLMNPGP